MTDVKAFLDGLRRQREKYREMATAVEDQKKRLATPDMDALMAMVERKRALMGEIEELEKDLAPTKERWTELRAGLEANVVKEVEEIVEETRKLLADLIKLEDEGRALLLKQRDTAAEELKDFMKKKKARGAYGGPGGADPRFFDRKK